MVVYIKDYSQSKNYGDNKRALTNQKNVTRKSNIAPNSLELEAIQKSLDRAKRRSW